MGERALNQFRSDKALREDCAVIYEALGMDLHTAFRMFMERTRMARGLPFPAVLPENWMTSGGGICTRGGAGRARNGVGGNPRRRSGKRSEPLSDCAVDTDASEKPEKRRKAVCK